MCKNCGAGERARRPVRNGCSTAWACWFSHFEKPVALVAQQLTINVVPSTAYGHAGWSLYGWRVLRNHCVAPLCSSVGGGVTIRNNISLYTCTQQPICRLKTASCKTKGPVVCFSDVILTKNCYGTLVLVIAGLTRLKLAIVLAMQGAVISRGGAESCRSFRAFAEGRGCPGRSPSLPDSMTRPGLESALPDRPASNSLREFQARIPGPG